MSVVRSVCEITNGESARSPVASCVITGTIGCTPGLISKPAAAMRSRKYFVFPSSLARSSLAESIISNAFRLAVTSGGGTARELTDEWDQNKFVLIDEAQFLTQDQVRQLHRLAHQHRVPVLCYGLRSDFRGDPFPGAAALLTLADTLEEMKNICACGRKASMNLRVDDNGRRVKEGEQIFIGGNESYRAVCPNCFYSEYEDPVRAPGLFG